MCSLHLEVQIVGGKLLGFYLLLGFDINVTGQMYCIMRLGFDSTIAPMIMQSIMSSVTSQDRAIQHAMSSYNYNVFM